MDGIHDWANLLVRWFHVIAGIAWIGSSFYFVWLDSSLEPAGKDDADDVEGHLWMVHSGGFYRVEKKKLVPSTMPETLHWFKWEAGLTFLSGFTLLIVVYYLSGGVLLVDSSVSDISVAMARTLGIATLVLGWAVYDFLWVSPLATKGRFANILSCIGLGCVAYVLSQFLSGRAAYMHVGAMMGTIMVANVWMRILPAQRALIAATTEGGSPDPKLAKRAKQRSMHNNYMTLPVVFVMISNHYYGTYGHEWNWLVLILIMIAGAGAQHLRNQSEHGQKWSRAVIVTVAVALCSLFVLTGNYGPEDDEEETTSVSATQTETKTPANKAIGPKPANKSSDKAVAKSEEVNTNPAPSENEEQKTEAEKVQEAQANTEEKSKAAKEQVAKDDKAGSESDSSAPTESVTTQSNSSIDGVVTFKGTVPKPKRVKLMPGCASKPGAKVSISPIKTNKSNRLAEVFVYIKKGAEKLPKTAVPKDPVVIDQKGCVYKPHVIGVRAKQFIQLMNSDPTLHNVRALTPKNKTKFNLAMPSQDMVIKKKFKKPGIMYRLKCDVHPWMSAFVGVVNHSYFGVTNTDGYFNFGELPPGEYTIEAWHETLGTLNKAITVSAKSAQTIEFEFTQE